MPDFSNRLLARFAGQRFSYRWYSDIQLARQGIVLEQNKEPALSGGIQRICSRTLDHVPIDDLQEGDDIVAIARKAGIIDENTGRPLYLLLDRARNSGCRIIIADALDDEPYISSQLAPALEMTDQLVRGIELAKEAVGAESARIEIYKELGDSPVTIRGGPGRCAGGPCGRRLSR